MAGGTTVALALLLGGWALVRPTSTPTTPAVADIGHQGPFDHDLVVPLGAAELVAAGETVPGFPGSLTARVGETLRIRNLDDRPVVIGPFALRAGETLTQRFTRPGALTGYCALHPDRSFRLVVEPA